MMRTRTKTQMQRTGTTKNRRSLESPTNRARAKKRIRDSWRDALCSWAKQNDAVRELWLFGSRAKGTDKAISDVDLAFVLMPASGKHDWALGAYVDLHSKWKADLKSIVGRHVSFKAIFPGGDGWGRVRKTSSPLWPPPIPHLSNCNKGLARIS